MEKFEKELKHKMSVADVMVSDKYLEAVSRLAFEKGVEAVFDELKSLEIMFYRLSMAYTKLKEKRIV